MTRRLPGGKICWTEPVAARAARGRVRAARRAQAAENVKKTPRAGHDHRARRGRQQDRAGQAQEGPDERLDGPLRLRGEDSRGFLRLFGDRGLRHKFAAQVDRDPQSFPEDAGAVHDAAAHSQWDCQSRHVAIIC